jgi:hypothetical protein
MPFSNPQVIAFLNAKARPLADQIVALSAQAQLLQATAAAQGINAALAAATATDSISDGSPQDGRPPMTVQDAIDFLTEVNNALTALGNTQAVQKALKIHVN